MYFYSHWLDDVECNGTEESLNQCSHADWNVTDCTHMEDTAVLCYNGTAGDHKISILTTERRGLDLNCISQPLHLFSFRPYLQLFHETVSLRPWLDYNIFSHSE